MSSDLTNVKVFLFEGDITSTDIVLNKMSEQKMLDATTIFVTSTKNIDNTYIIDGSLPYDIIFNDSQGNNIYKFSDLNILTKASLIDLDGNLLTTITTKNGIQHTVKINDYQNNLNIIEEFNSSINPDSTTSGSSQNTPSSKQVNKETFVKDVTENNTPLLVVTANSSLVLNEGDNTQSQKIQLTAELNKPSTENVQFQLALNNSSENVNNIQLLQQSIIIPAGETSISFDALNISGDNIVENDAVSTLTIQNVKNARIASTNQNMQIALKNDDSFPPNFNLNISTDPQNILEGNDGETKTVNVIVSLKEAQNADLSYYLLVSDLVDNANAVTLFKTPYVLAKGLKSMTIPVQLKGDNLVETNELIKFQLFVPDFATNALIDINSNLTAELKITDDDVFPKLHIDSTKLTFDEQDQTHTQIITIYTQDKIYQPISFNLTTSQNDLISPINQVFTIDSGQNSIDIPIQIIGNKDINADQKINFQINNLKNATIDNLNYDIVIKDDDYIPNLLVQMPSSLNEDGTLQIQVSLDRSINKKVSFHIKTVNNTATSDDFQSLDQTVTFEPNETTATINLSSIDDLILEQTENFQIQVDQLNGIQFESGENQKLFDINIYDNDYIPILNVEPIVANIYEGTSNFNILNFNAYLDKVAPQDVSFKVQTQNITAIAGKDFQFLEQIITIPKGSKNASFQIQTIPNDLIDQDRQLEILISDVKNANNQVSQPILLTIQDDDKAPVVSISPKNIEVLESQNDKVGVAEFKIELDHAYSKNIKVQLETVNGTAIAGKDYKNYSQEIEIQAGELSHTIQLEMIADTEPEADETFSLKILSATNATIGTESEATIKILDTQPLPSLQLDQNAIEIIESDPTTSKPEIPTEYSEFKIPLKLSSLPILKSTTIDVSVSSHNDIKDFIFNNQTVTFDSEGNASILLKIANDFLKEEDKTFTLEFSNPNGINILDENNSKLTINLKDNDNFLELLKVSVDQNPILEPSKLGDKSTLTIHYELPHSLPEDVSFAIATDDDTAVSTGKNPDFNPIDQIITLKSGEYKGKITLDILGDNVKESNLETFKILTTTDSNNIEIDNQSQEISVSIKDSQALPSVGIKNLTLTSKNDEEQNLNMTISSDIASTEDIAITADLILNQVDPITQKIIDTKTFPIKFDLSSRKLEYTYSWNLKDHNVTLSTTNNTTAELKITKVTNASIDTKTGSLFTTIQDISTVLPKIISISPKSIHLKEGDTTPNFSIITIKLDKPVQNQAGASFTLSPYDLNNYKIIANGNESNVITIPTGEQSISVTLQTVPNLKVESDKEYRLQIDKTSLINLQLSSSSDNEIEFTIENDDEKSDSSTKENPSKTETEDLPKLSVTNIVATEQSLNSSDAYTLKPLIFTLSKASTEDITFDISTAIDGSRSAINQANTTDYYSLLLDSSGNTITNLTISAGKTSATAYVKIFDDKLYESTEYFNVNISNVQGNARLQRSSATVQINDNDINIISIDLPTAGTYKQDDELLFTVHFSSAVTVNSSNLPQLILSVGGQTQYATYEEGNGSSSLSFIYKVEKNLEDSDGIEILSFDPTSLISTGNLDTTIPSIDTSSILIDSLPPTLQTATLSRDQLILTFSEEIQNMPSTADFAVEDDDGAISVTDVLMQDNHIILTLEKPITALNNLKIAYDPQSNQLITDLVGNEIDSFSDVQVIDNNLPLLSISPMNIYESETTKYELVTFTLNKTSSNDVTFDVMVIADPNYSGTINEAIENEDFDSILYDESLNPITSLTIPAGETFITANLKILGDTNPEATKYLQIHANNFQNAINIPIYNHVILTDNDSGIIQASVNNIISNTMNLDLVFNNASSSEYTITNLILTKGSSVIQLTSDPITIPALSFATENITADILNSVNLPADTTPFTLTATLSNSTTYSTNLEIPYDINTGVSQMSVSDILVNEADQTGILIFTLDKISASDISFDLETVKDSATPDDFEISLFDETGTNAITSLTIPAGSTSATAKVKIIDDALPENLEQFKVNIKNIQGLATISNPSVNVEIQDNDSGIVNLTFQNPNSTPITSIPMSVLINNFTGFNDLNLTELSINSTPWTISPASTPITGQVLNLQLTPPANTQLNQGNTVTINAFLSNGIDSYNYFYDFILPYTIDTIVPSAPKLINPDNPNLIFASSNYYINSSLASSITDLSLQVVFKNGELQNGDTIQIFDANESTTPIATKTVVTSDIQSVGMSLGLDYSTDSYIIVPLDISSWGISSKQLIAKFVDQAGNMSSASPNLNLMIGDGQNISLTTSNDNIAINSSKTTPFEDTITGTLHHEWDSINSQVDETLSTLNINDTIDGSLGIDTLKAELYVDPNSSSIFQDFYLPDLNDIEKLEFTTALNTHTAQDYSIYLPYSISYSTTGMLDIFVNNIDYPNSFINLYDINNQFTSNIYVSHVTSQFGMNANYFDTILNLYLDTVHINNANSSTVNTFANDNISTINFYSLTSDTLESLYFERFNQLTFDATNMSAPLKLSIRADATGDTSMMGSHYNDTLIGGTDNDTIYGSLGNDLIYGSSSDLINGNDILTGEDGNDTLVASIGATTLIGGLGADEFKLDPTILDVDTVVIDDFNPAEDVISLNRIGNMFINTITNGSDEVVLNTNDIHFATSKAEILPYQINLYANTISPNSFTVSGASAIEAIIVSMTSWDVYAITYDNDWRDTANRKILVTFDFNSNINNSSSFTNAQFRIFNNGKAISLTSSIDNVSGSASDTNLLTTSSNDTIEATELTLNSSAIDVNLNDTIDGQGGYDILNITNNDSNVRNITLPSTTSNIEKVTLFDNNSSTNTMTWNLTASNPFQAIVVHNATTTKTQDVNSIKPYDTVNNIYPTLKVVNNQGDVNFNFNTVNSSSVLNLEVNNLNSTTDSIHLNTTSVSGASSYLGLTINSIHPDANGVNQLKSIQGNSLKTLTITGDNSLILTNQAITATGLNSENPFVVNASSFGSHLNISFDISSVNVSIVGSANDDTLSGSSANDTIKGGLGIDSLTGGSGNNTFIFDNLSSPTNSPDVITDIKVNDIIYLNGYILASENTFTSFDILKGGIAVFKTQGLSLQDKINALDSQLTNFSVAIFDDGLDAYIFSKSDVNQSNQLIKLENKANYEIALKDNANGNFVISTLPAINAQNLTSGLLAYYSFTGNFEDSANQNNPTSVGTSALNSGVIGTALSLNGTNAISLPSSFDFSNGFTFSYFSKSNVSDLRQVFSRGNGSFWSPDQFTIREIVNNSVPIVVAGGVALSTIGIGFANYNRVNLENIATNLSDNLNAFRQITVTIDNTDIKIYDNGILKSTASVNQNGYNFFDNLTGTNTFPILIGSGEGWYNYDGLIDEIAIYNKALTPTEVNSFYHTFDKTLYGTNLADTLSVESSNYIVHAYDGDDSVSDSSNLTDVHNDTFYGGLGNDTLISHSGNDLLEGNDGNDFLEASIGNNILNGGLGDDTLIGSQGIDVLEGGLGADLFEIHHGDTSATVISGSVQTKDFILDNPDVITDYQLTELDNINLYDNANSIVTTISSNLADNTISYIKGTFDSEMQRFTQNDSTTYNKILMVYDSDSTVGSQHYEYVLLLNQTPPSVSVSPQTTFSEGTNTDFPDNYMPIAFNLSQDALVDASFDISVAEDTIVGNHSVSLGTDIDSSFYNSDVNATAITRLTIPAGHSTALAYVKINQDNQPEYNETAKINITNFQNSQLNNSSSLSLTITDDDSGLVDVNFDATDTLIGSGETGHLSLIVNNFNNSSLYIQSISYGMYSITNQSTFSNRYLTANTGAQTVDVTYTFPFADLYLTNPSLDAWFGYYSIHNISKASPYIIDTQAPATPNTSISPSDTLGGSDLIISSIELNNASNANLLKLRISWDTNYGNRPVAVGDKVSIYDGNDALVKQFTIANNQIQATDSYPVTYYIDTDIDISSSGLNWQVDNNYILKTEITDTANNNSGKSANLTLSVTNASTLFLTSATAETVTGDATDNLIYANSSNLNYDSFTIPGANDYVNGNSGNDTLNYILFANATLPATISNVENLIITGSNSLNLNTNKFNTITIQDNTDQYATTTLNNISLTSSGANPNFKIRNNIGGVNFYLNQIASSNQINLEINNLSATYGSKIKFNYASNLTNTTIVNVNSTNTDPNGINKLEQIIGSDPNSTFKLNQLVFTGTNSIQLTNQPPINIDASDFGNAINIEITQGINYATNPILIGSAYNDTITGGFDVGDSISGGVGNDELYGQNGSDTLDGGAGDDYLYGDYDNDVLTGGLGVDTIKGGYGSDTYKFTTGDTSANIVSGNILTNNLVVQSPDILEDFYPYYYMNGNIYTAENAKGDKGIYLTLTNGYPYYFDNNLSNGLSDKSFGYIAGNYNYANGIFTQNSTDNGLLIVAKNGGSLDYIVLPNTSYGIGPKGDLDYLIYTDIQQGIIENNGSAESYVYIPVTFYLTTPAWKTLNFNVSVSENTDGINPATIGSDLDSTLYDENHVAINSLSISTNSSYAIAYLKVFKDVTDEADETFKLNVSIMNGQDFGSQFSSNILTIINDDGSSAGADSQKRVVSTGTQTISDFAHNDILVIDSGATAQVDTSSITNFTNVSNSGTLEITAKNSNDIIFGSTGNDVINSLNGDDLVSGGDGDDTLIGGLGIDELTGNEGSDTFKFNHGDTSTTTTGTISSNNLTVTNSDVIKDYTQNIDIIKLYDNNNTLITTVDYNLSDGITDNSIVYIRGSFDNSTHTFTQTNSPNATNVLVVYDSDASASQHYEYIVLQNQPIANVYSVSSPSITASESGIFAYTMTRTDGSNADTLNYSIVNGTTTNADFSAMSGSVNFAVDQTEQIIIIPVVNDATIEVDETFTLNLTSTNINHIITNSTLSGIIKDGFTLTTATGENIVGDVNNNIFTATSLTLNNTDSIDGGDGYDILNIALTTNYTEIANLQPHETLTHFKNIEEFNIDTTGAVSPLYFEPNGIYFAITGNSIHFNILGNQDISLGRDSTVSTYGRVLQSSINYINATNLTGKFTLYQNTSAGDNQQSTIWGGANSDNFYITGDGNETIYAGTSDDLIQTSAGNDSLNGEDGNDTLDGGLGSDTLNGGIGNDTFIYANTSSLFTANALVDSLVGGAGIDSIQFNDVSSNTGFTITSADNWSRLTEIEKITVTPSSGIYSITLSASAETAGINTIDLSGDTNSTGNNLIDVSAYTSTAMTLIGSTGNDTLIGSVGIDTLTGGNGADQFIFYSGDSHKNEIFLADGVTTGIDLITDFSISEDSLKLYNNLSTPTLVTTVDVDTNSADGFADNSVAYVRGTYDTSTDKFHVNQSASSPDVLVVYDSDNSSLKQYEAIALKNIPVTNYTVATTSITAPESGTFSYTITRTNPILAETINYSIVNGTTTNADFSAMSGSVNFAVGDTSKTITISVINDTTFEPDETFTVNLTSTNMNSFISNPTLSGTIVNNDDFRINNYQADIQGLPRAKQLPNGKIVAVWTDTRNEHDVNTENNGDIYGTVLNADGSKYLTTDIRLDSSSTGRQALPSLSTMSNNNFFTVWEDYRNGGTWTNNTGGDIYGSIFDFNGNRISPNGDIRIDSSSGGTQGQPKITNLLNNNQLILWNDRRNVNSDIYSSIFNSSGTRLVTPDTRVTADNSNQYATMSLSLSNGTYITVWEDWRNGGADVYGAVYNNDGSRVSVNDIRIDNSTSGSQWTASLVQLSNGNLMIIWQDNRNGVNYDIYGAIFDVNLNRISSSDIKINAGTANDLSNLSMLTLSDKTIIVWTDKRNGGSDIYGTILDQNAAKLINSDFKIDASSSGNQAVPSITTISNNQFMVVWQDDRNDLNDVYGRIFDVNNLISLYGIGSAMQKQPTLSLDSLTENQAQSVGQPLNLNSTVNLNPNQFGLTSMTNSLLKTESILGNLNNNMLAG